MPRSNHPRNRQGGEHRVGDSEENGLERLLASWRHTEIRRGVEWNIQLVSSAQAQKEYRCPGCARDIPPGLAHVVAWRADGVLGDAADLAGRRHWHTACWRIA